jgi:hypothetical protein
MSLSIQDFLYFAGAPPGFSGTGREFFFFYVERSTTYPPVPICLILGKGNRSASSRLASRRRSELQTAEECGLDCFALGNRFGGLTDTLRSDRTGPGLAGERLPWRGARWP